MKNAFRYVMVGMLVCGMAVDQATARRLFQRRCCRPKCVATCPAPCHVDPCDSPVVTEHCAPTCSGCADPACEHCAVEAPAEVVTQEYVPPTPVPADTYGPIDQYTPTEAPTPVAEDPTPAPEATMPPAPLAVPEQDDVAAPAPVEPPPVETAPADVGDRYSNDIFSPTLPEEDEPAEPPADPAPQEDDTEDIFSEPTSTFEDETPADDIPAPTEETPAEESTPPPGMDDEDIFAPMEPNDGEEEEEEPADEPIEEPTEEPIEEPQESELPPPAEPYDPFSQTRLETTAEFAALAEPGGLRSDRDRIWTDNTATYQCEARLLQVTSKHVVLQRSTGKQLTVPFSRLANVDLQFVQQQISALRIVRARDAAAEKLATAWSR